MEPLADKTILITGATDGMGRHLVGRLAAAGAHVVVHGRNAGKVDRVVADVLSAVPGARLDSVLADLASLRAVDELADEVDHRFDRLDVLVNNAGVGFGSGQGTAPRERSADGIELRFAVNYLAGYHLTRRLVPLLVASAPARVVNVASAGQFPIDFADPLLTESYDGVRAYRQSKLAQIMFTFDLADELAADGVTATALHPATLMDTTMVRDADLPSSSTIGEGADATVRLIGAAELAGVTGRYFDGTRECRAHDQAYDLAARAELRTLSEELIGARVGPR